MIQFGGTMKRVRYLMVDWNDSQLKRRDFPKLMGVVVCKNKVEVPHGRN